MVNCDRVQHRERPEAFSIRLVTAVTDCSFTLSRPSLQETKLVICSKKKICHNTLISWPYLVKCIDSESDLVDHC